MHRGGPTNEAKCELGRLSGTRQQSGNLGWAASCARFVVLGTPIAFTGCLGTTAAAAWGHAKHAQSAESTTWRLPVLIMVPPWRDVLCHNGEGCTRIRDALAG